MAILGQPTITAPIVSSTQSTISVAQFNALVTNFNNLQSAFNSVSYAFYQHKHKGYDYTQILPATYARYQLVDQATLVTDATLGVHFYVTLGGNRTLGAPTGMQGGQRILFEFIQDGTGSRTITLASIFDKGAFTITLTTTVHKRDFMEAVYSDVDNKFYVINFVKGY